MGLLSLAHAAFYGIGAYTTALLAHHVGGSFAMLIFAAMTVGAITSLLISIPAVRLHGDYFVIASLGLQIIIFNVFNNLVSVTHGPLGMAGIAAPSLAGLSVSSPAGYVFLGTVLSIFSYVIIRNITNSPLGRILRSIREDEIFAQALGKDTVRVKMIVFATSAAIASAAGCLYAQYVSFIDPTSFTLNESILLVSMVVIGGLGSAWGPLVGAAMLVLLPEVLRFLGLPSTIAANVRQILYGAALVVMMIIRPHGLMGRHGFKR